MELNEITEKLKNFLDDGGRLKSYPAKGKLKLMSLFYLASKFESGKTYTEKEVNLILNEWHSFGDWALLRRELCDRLFFDRERDGSGYRMREPQPTLTAFGLGN